jgi:DNA-directed RNA polymerase subunit K/omega
LHNILNVKAAKNGKQYETVIPFDMGEDSGLAAIQEIADGLIKDEIIKELNKE